MPTNSMARCSADHQIRLRERGYFMSMIGRQFTVYMMLIAISPVIWTSKDAEAKTAVSHSCGADAYEPNNRRSRARNLSYELKHDRRSPRISVDEIQIGTQCGLIRESLWSFTSPHLWRDHRRSRSLRRESVSLKELPGASRPSTDRYASMLSGVGDIVC